jgi:uncharacterized Zn finger protein
MVDIKCLLCEETLKIHQLIDIEDYDGQLSCQKCKSLFQVKIVKSKLNKYRVVKKGTRHLTKDEYFKIMKRAGQLLEGSLRDENV